jgi:hypothetical protein
VWRPRWGARDYFWFLFNNIVGWALILAAGPLGVLIPGPTGLPLFLIGFAMITLPGKRALTARVLRGVPVQPRSRAYRWTAGALAVIGPAAFLSWVFWLMGRGEGRWYLLSWEDWRLIFFRRAPWEVAAFVVYVGLVVLVWIFAIRGAHVINLVLARMPAIRRRTRPWLRRQGLDLLPPRRRQRLLHKGAPADESILAIDSRYRNWLVGVWRAVVPWLGLATVVAAGAVAIVLALRAVHRGW